MNGDGRRFRASSSVRSLPYQENRLNRRVRLRVYNKLPREVQVADGKLSTTKENNPRERSQTPSHLNALLYVFYTNRHDFIRRVIIDSLYCAVLFGKEMVSNREFPFYCKLDDRIARGMFPNALYSSRNHDNCRRVTVSSAALGQLVRSRFRVYSKRDERKGEKEPAEA
ncbi:hypothetical protein ALC56_10615 [Trachymyrmex septentrionalis]|uniref:Uncharacterized protein n=1 Tax=Trachymyrmex septentrionalis TaxID=34720 RepID=A0A195F3I4_9HYME|nr:hypothetical protein ALC56_10615 [Trachymyrmex septentrionalis]